MARTLSPEKRSRYLLSALKLFVANGVKKTSTAAIAEEAGTAAGTLFLYFPTKQDLIHELVLDIAHQQSDYIKTSLAPSLPAKETFHKIWSGSIQWFLDNMDSYHYIRQVRDSGLIAEDVISESKQYLDYYYTAIQKGLQEGAIKTYPLELVGTFLYQGIVAVMNLVSSGINPDQHTTYIQNGFDIFWDGIKTR
jgi:AcrR family transcriptional regulator